MPDENISTAAPDTPVAETPAADAAPEWDGSDWSALDAQPWWKAIPESAREHLSKAHEERVAAKERSDFLDRLFQADDDGLRREHEAAVKERDELRAERDSLKESLAGIEARQAQEAEDREYARLEAKFPDIWKDIHLDEKGEIAQKGAYVKFVKLLQAGFDEDEAASMARAVMVNKPASTEAAAPAAPAKPAPPKVREVEAPPSVKNMGKGGNNPAATVNMKEANETLDQRARRLQKQYEEEERRAGE